MKKKILFFIIWMILFAIVIHNMIEDVRKNELQNKEKNNLVITNLNT